MLRGVAADEIRQIAVRGDLVQGRKAELAQDCCSSSAPAPRLWDATGRSKARSRYSGISGGNPEYDWTARTLPIGKAPAVGGSGDVRCVTRSGLAVAQSSPRQVPKSNRRCGRLCHGRTAYADRHGSQIGRSHASPCGQRRPRHSRDLARAGEAPTRWSAWATWSSSSTTPTTRAASSPTCSASRTPTGSSSCAPPAASTRPARFGRPAVGGHRPPGRAIEAAVRKQYAELFAAFPTPTYATYGNVDIPRLWPEYAGPGTTVLDGETAEIGGRVFGFVGGGLRTPMRTPYEIDDEEYAAKVAALGEVDVLCSHIPPDVPELCYDTVARRFERGSEALLEAIRAHRARVRPLRPRPPAAGAAHADRARPSASTSATSTPPAPRGPWSGEPRPVAPAGRGTAAGTRAVACTLQDLRSRTSAHRHRIWRSHGDGGTHQFEHHDRGGTRRRHGRDRRLRPLPGVDRRGQGGRGPRRRTTRAAPSRCGCCSTPARSRTTTPSPTPGSATTRSAGRWSSPRCCAPSTAPTPRARRRRRPHRGHLPAHRRRQDPDARHDQAQGGEGHHRPRAGRPEEARRVAVAAPPRTRRGRATGLTAAPDAHRRRRPASTRLVTGRRAAAPGAADAWPPPAAAPTRADRAPPPLPLTARPAAAGRTPPADAGGRSAAPRTALPGLARTGAARGPVAQPRAHRPGHRRRRRRPHHRRRRHRADGGPRRHPHPAAHRRPDRHPRRRPRRAHRPGPRRGGPRPTAWRLDAAARFREDLAAVQERGSAALDLLGAARSTRRNSPNCPARRRSPCCGRCATPRCRTPAASSSSTCRRRPQALALLALPGSCAATCAGCCPRAAGRPRAAPGARPARRRPDARRVAVRGRRPLGRELAAVQAVIEDPATTVRLVAEPGPARPDACAPRVPDSRCTACARRRGRQPAAAGRRPTPGCRPVRASSEDAQGVARRCAPTAPLHELPHLGRDPRGDLHDLARAVPGAAAADRGRAAAPGRPGPWTDRLADDGLLVWRLPLPGADTRRTSAWCGAATNSSSPSAGSGGSCRCPPRCAAARSPAPRCATARCGSASRPIPRCGRAAGAPDGRSGRRRRARARTVAPSGGRRVHRASRRSGRQRRTAVRVPSKVRTRRQEPP